MTVATRVMIRPSVRMTVRAEDLPPMCRRHRSAGNDRVTGIASATMSPPPGRFRPAGCRRAAPRARPRSRGPGPTSRRPSPARRVGLPEPVEQVRQRVGRRRPAPGPRRRRPRHRVIGVSETSTARARARGRGRCPAGCRGSAPAGAGRSRRRPAGDGSTTAAAGWRAATTAVTSRPRSIAWIDGRSAAASKREISIRSSTSVRSRRTSATSSCAARRPSGGSPSSEPSRSDASATSAVSGVRSSCDTSATNRRFWPCASSRRVTVAWSESAIRLKSSAQRAISSCPPVGTRAARSPAAIRRAAVAPAVDRPEDAARDQAGRDEGEEDRQQPAREQAEPELGERVLDGSRREHEVERRAGRLAPADDERRLAADRLPRVARARRRATMSRSAGETPSRAPGRRAGTHGTPSPKSAMTSASPRSRNCSGRPLAPNASASAGGGSIAGSRTDRLKSACWRASATSRSRSEASTNA